jgi:hypothetical protein
MKGRIGLLVLALVGCSPPREAPEDLGQIGVFFFSDFERTPAEVGTAVQRLEAIFAEQVPWDGERRDRRFEIPILTFDDLHDVVHPDVDPELQSPVAQGRLSTRSVDEHAALQLQADHTPFEPSSPNGYDRTFETDPGCWGDGSCDELLTANRIVKQNVLYTVPYDTWKHFRRYELSDGRTAFVSRTWSEEVGVGEQGVNSIDQNYATEAWIGTPDGGTWRMQFAWSSVTLGDNDLEDVDIRGIIGNGIDQTIGRQDDWLAEQ